MTSPKWMGQLPQEQAATFPRGADDVVDLHDRRFVGASVAKPTSVERPEIVSVALERCDIAGFIGQHGRAERVLVEGTRLRGVIWANGIVRDVHFVEAIALETSFRFSELRRVLFRDCKLAGIDFTRATFDDVRFE